MTDEHEASAYRESVALFFKNFEDHLVAVRDQGAEAKPSYRANLLINQLRQFEKAVNELPSVNARAAVDERFLERFFQVETLDELVAWMTTEQNLAPLTHLYYRQENGDWLQLHGEEGDVFRGLAKRKEWVVRGLLARLEGDGEVLAAHVYGAPRLVMRFDDKDGPEGPRLDFALFTARLLPLFVPSPLADRGRFYEGKRGLIARDPVFVELLSLIQKASQTDVNILLEGESGTGKEVVANFIHTNSSRTRHPLVAVNCAAIPAGLMESELFGHEKGAFTGAYSRQIGQVEQADGGTLFLDEIGEMELAMQAKLLRFLQLKEFHRVGGKQKIQVDVRIVAATNRDLKDQVKKGLFREDLYYRLSVMPFLIPSLRERVADITPLAEFFFKKYGKQFHREEPEVDPMVFQILAEYSFPGNVRELENLVQNTLVMSQGAPVTPGHLPESLRREKPRGKPAPAERIQRVWRPLSKRLVRQKLRVQEEAPRMGVVHEWQVKTPRDNDGLKEMKAAIQEYANEMTLDLERRFLDDLLKRAEGSFPRAGKLANINRTLLYKMQDRVKKHEEAKQEETEGEDKAGEETDE